MTSLLPRRLRSSVGVVGDEEFADAGSKRVFLLGPSHHVYLPGVALSSFAKYATPLGDIPLCLDSMSSPAVDHIPR